MIAASQLATLTGLGSGLGLILIFREIAGRHTRQLHLADTANRLTGSADIAMNLGDSHRGAARVGRLLLRRSASWPLLHIPHRDLALLHTGVASFVGERVLCALVGLALPPACVLALAFAGVSLPITVPVGLSLVLGFGLSYIPLYSTMSKARAIRAEFRRAMTLYVDLVALERAAGAGTTQALESAAQIGNSWAFRRLHDELAHARWTGTPAWDALRVLGIELRLPELTETAAVMRMSARQGATVYNVLRARAAAMRSEILTRDQAKAGSRTERASVPMAATAVVFMLILAAPVAMQIG